MNTFEATTFHPDRAIAILGVPFDRVTMGDALAMIERMTASRRPHYIVTANVDFLAQARTDVELRRILLDAHLVLCDGTPVVWASRLLGNPLPERVAGSDLVPALIAIAEQKGLRAFFLGGTPESMSRAIANVKKAHPGLDLQGFSPPFNQLLEMDHEEIKRRITEARPDLLFVSFGCPKQEKWIAMHYQSLGVPVAIGVGGTIDFLAGQLKRAPVWMQRTGTEWMFRLLQEPRRLFRRYARDLGVFVTALIAQWWMMKFRNHVVASTDVPSCSAQGSARNSTREKRNDKNDGCIRKKRRIGGFVAIQPLRRVLRKSAFSSRIKDDAEWQWVQMPASLDATAVRNDPLLRDLALADGRHCLLQLDRTQFIDSTATGWLIRLQKKIRATGKQLVLIAPSPGVNRALRLMHLETFFPTAPDCEAALQLIEKLSVEQREYVHKTLEAGPSAPANVVRWRGEITAANAEPVWQATEKLIPRAGEAQPLMIDLSDVRFMDSSGVGLMVRARKYAQSQGIHLSFAHPRAAVLNVLRLARLEAFLLGASIHQQAKS